MIDISKLLVIGISVLFVAGCGMLIIESYLDDDELISEGSSKNIIVKDPSTGEVWNSIEEYEFRNLKLNEVING